MIRPRTEPKLCANSAAAMKDVNVATINVYRLIVKKGKDDSMK